MDFVACSRNKDDVLEKVRTGKVFSDEQEIKDSPAAAPKKAKSTYDDRLKLIKDAETRLDELLMEKRQVCCVYFGTVVSVLFVLVAV